MRWFLYTEHEHESLRLGVGEESLSETIEHLRRRGDTRARVSIEGQAWEPVWLRDPTVAHRLAETAPRPVESRP